MSSLHPDRAALEKFLDDRLSEADGLALERHLFACRECEESLIRLLPHPGKAWGRTPGAREAEREIVHQTMLREVLGDTRAEADCRRVLLARERRQAKELWEELCGVGAAERRRLVAADPRFHTWGLFEHLLELAPRLTLAEPRRAEEQLRLALDLSDHLAADRYGPGSGEAAKARAWTYLGNSLRILSDFRQAEQAFQEAEACFLASWLDPLDEAMLLENKGSLRRAQRRFEESVRLLDGAVGLYRELNEPHLHGRALMRKGLALQYNGEIAAATSCFRESLNLLDGAEEPRLVAASRFNLINCLFDGGQITEAAALIPEARLLMEQADAPADLLHLRWLEAQIAAALGRTAEAEQTLLAVKEAFSTARAAFDAALVALELAALYARQGRSAEVKRLAEEIIPIFQSCEVPQEALAAVIVLQNAAEMEQITLGLVEEVSALLERVGAHPGLRFRSEEEQAVEDAGAR